MVIRSSTAHALLLVLLGLACGERSDDVPARQHPPESYPLAYYHLDCAPWDGPAVSILLVREPMTEPWAPGTHLRLSIYSALPDLMGRTVSWTADQGTVGYAGRCEGEGPCEPAAAARIRIREAGDGGAWLVGDVELTFANGLREAGAFRAQRLQRRVLCG